MQGVKAFLEAFPNVFEEYLYIWLLEEDLFIPTSTVKSVISACQWRVFPIFQPSLTVDSYFSFAVTVQNKQFYVRATDFVEQMCPALSTNFLSSIYQSFDENYSGFGYEWLWQRRFEEIGDFAAILDHAPVYHVRPVGGGSLLSSMPGQTTRADELKAFLREHKLGTRILCYGGISLGNQNWTDGFQIVSSETDLICRQIAGYNYTLNFDEQTHSKIIQAAIGHVSNGKKILPNYGARREACRSKLTLLVERLRRDAWSQA